MLFNLVFKTNFYFFNHLLFRAHIGTGNFAMYVPVGKSWLLENLNHAERQSSLLRKPFLLLGYIIPFLFLLCLFYTKEYRVIPDNFVYTIVQRGDTIYYPTSSTGIYSFPIHVPEKKARFSL
jgi:hypothetical protein